MIGTVGIGTTSPTAPLEVFTSNTGVNAVNFAMANNATGGFLINSPSGDQILMIPSASPGAYNPLVQSGDSLLMFSGGTPTTTGNLVIAPWSGSAVGMRMTSAGNVGIGTTSPAGNLDVENGSNTATICLNGTCSTSISTATSGTLCGQRSIYCNGATVSYDQSGSTNTKCNGTVITATCASPTPTVSCPTGYTGSATYTYCATASACYYTATCAHN